MAYQKRVTGFPRTSFLLSVLSAAGLYWFGNIGGWGALAFAFVQFCLMGGLTFFKLFYRTVPRDLKFMMCGAKLMAGVKTKTAQNKMTYEYFTETSQRYPNKPAIISIGLDGAPDRIMTFCELEEYINQIANYFLSCGLKKGDCVALFLENSPESFALYLGLSKIGVISALVNSNLKKESLLHCIKISECIGLVFSSSLSEAVSEVLPGVDPAVRKYCFSVCGPAGTVSEAKRLEDVLEGVSKDPPPLLKDKQITDIVMYIYTSGTTGLPKACRVDDMKVFRGPIIYIEAGRITDSDRLYCTIPLCHTHGLIHGGGTMIYQGCTLVIRSKFSAKDFWTDCAKYNCTMEITIGELCRYLVAQLPQSTDTQHKVRLSLSIGLKKEVWLKYQKRFKVAKIIEGYGATDGNTGFINIGNKPGSIGAQPIYLPYPMNNHYLKLDPNTGDYLRDKHGFCVDCGVNEPGELVCEIAKAAPFLGYRNKQSSEKKILRDVFKKGDAFFRTGDIMKVDEEGWVFFCDRSEDTFRWKGENVSTAEVECHISSILEFTDVVVYGVEVPGHDGRAGMAAIAGIPDTVNLSELPGRLSLSLPPYVVPWFVRLITSAEVTDTFRLQKVKLRKEGYDMTQVTDPLYLLKDGSYIPLKEDVFQQIQEGNMRL